MSNKCDSCTNSRTIISENGYHSLCCLSSKKAVKCLNGEEDSYVCYFRSVEKEDEE